MAIDMFDVYVETKIMDDDKVKEKYNVGKNQVLKVMKAMVIDELKEEGRDEEEEKPTRRRKPKEEAVTV